MSLVISLTCALLATLLQQWARRYLKITQSRSQPHKRARIRAFFAEGVEKCLLPWTVDALPTLLHLSLFLFFAGLVVFLCNVDLTIFKCVLSWVGLCAALYGCITCMPLFRHDSPYYTPLSLPTWHVVTGTLFFVCRLLRWFNLLFRRYYAYGRFLDLENSYRISLAQGMQKTAEETALHSPSEIDTRAFMWTFDCLDEDHELESFFSGLPGFRSSKVVEDPLPGLTKEETLKLYEAVDGFWNRTFSSDLLPAPIKDRRALICAKAVDPEHTPVDTPIDLEPKPTAFRILDVILSNYQYCGPAATGIAKVLSGWGNNMDEDKVMYVQSTIYKVLATRQPHNDSWYNLASVVLGFPETSLRDYATQGDSLSLIILIHVVRQQFSHSWKRSLSQKVSFSSILSEASRFRARNTSSELQHKFCALWNRIVHEAQGSNDWEMTRHTLEPIRYIFVSLHRDTDSATTKFGFSARDYDPHIKYRPSSYPLCKVSDHRSDSTPHTRNNGVSTTLARATLHDPDNTAFVSSIASLGPPPSSTHTPLPIFTDALPLENQIYVPVSTPVIGQTTNEGRQIPTISLSPVIEPSRTTQPSTPSPSPKSNASASPPADIAIAHVALSHAHSDDINVRSPPSPAPILDAILPTVLLSSHAATRSDLIYSSLKPHSSILAEGEGSMNAGMSMEEHASDSESPLVIRKDIPATADIPPQLSSLSRVTDVANDDPSKPCLGTEHMEQRPPDANAGEHSTVGRTHSSDVQVSSSPTLVLPIGMPFPLNSAVALSEQASFSLDSHSQMLAPAASGPSRSWDPSTAGEGEEGAKAGLRQGKGKDEPHDDNMLASDVPMRLLPLQPTINVANAGLSQSSLDAELTSEHSLRPRGEYDIV